MDLRDLQDVVQVQPQEAEPAQNRAGWLDEFWSTVLALPMLGAFVPGLQDVVSRGFQIISADVPGWYLTALAGAVSLAFGGKVLPGVLGGLARK